MRQNSQFLYRDTNREERDGKFILFLCLAGGDRYFSLRLLMQLNSTPWISIIISQDFYLRMRYNIAKVFLTVSGLSIKIETSQHYSLCIWSSNLKHMIFSLDNIIAVEINCTPSLTCSRPLSTFTCFWKDLFFSK